MATPIPGISAQTKGDFRLQFTSDPSTGTIGVDFMLTPQGDLARVTGIDRLVQMIVLWLLTPQGSVPWDPTYGNPFYNQIGRPNSPDIVDNLLGTLRACEDAFLASQDRAGQAGQLTQDEMVDHFADEQVRVTAPGQITLSFTIYAQSGVGTSVAIPFAASLAAGQAV